ncbi:MAG: hypothetical protein Q8R11_03965 [bacterium]|nr:hypothetical protein [bacterium]
MELAEQLPKPKQELTPLPFTFVRTNDKQIAEFIENRMPLISFTSKGLKPKTDEEIVAVVKQQKVGEQWYTQDYWREKGQPSEQIEIRLDGHAITLYNFRPEIQLTDIHVEQLKESLGTFTARFPNAMEKLRWILIADMPNSNPWGDVDTFPLSGTRSKSLKTLRLYPHAFASESHRIQTVSNLEGTIAHEIAHFIHEDFREEWSESFQWGSVSNCPNIWEPVPRPDGKKYYYRNKDTGEITYSGQFPLQPDACITEYGKRTWYEDIVESMVAYLYDPDRLRRVSPKKFEILARHDVNHPEPTVIAHRVPKDEVALPEIKPQTVFYYIKEPSQAPNLQATG